MIFRVRCMLMLRFLRSGPKNEKKKVERNVAVKWVMLFIYGRGHFAPPLSLPPSLAILSLLHTQGVIRAQHNC